MRSNELATLAGVTVRTLRHYHKVGILDEPARRSNGYRDYDVRHLIRVLRITRLSGLGFPLHGMQELLDKPEDDPIPQLDQLDGELQARIETLTSQRDLIKRLRDEHAAPDLPPALASYAAIFAASRLTPELAGFNREQVILLAHLIGEDGMSSLSRIYDRLSETGFLTSALDLNARFALLDDDTSDEVVNELARDMIGAVVPIVRDLAAVGNGIDVGEAGALVIDHSNRSLTPVQQRVLALVESQLRRR